MISGKRYFPVDIFAVKEYGIKRWQNEFFWPVSDEEFVRLYRDIVRLLLKQINGQPEEISNLLLVEHILLSEYLHFLHACKVIEKIRKEGRKILYSEKSLWYKEIIEDNLINNAILKRGTVKYANFKKIRIEISRFLKYLIYNVKFRKNFNFVSRKNLSSVYGSVRPLMKEFIAKSVSSFTFIPRYNLVSKKVSYRIPGMLLDSIKKVSGEIVSNLILIAQKNNIELCNNHISYLRWITENGMLDAAKILHFAKAKIDRVKTADLLVSGAGDSFSRALYILAKKKGIRITSFNHGGNIGLYPIFVLSEFNISDEFITYTRKSAELFGKVKKNFPSVRGNKVKVKSADSHQFYKLWLRYRNESLPNKIKRVMIIGHPHNQWRKPQVKGCFSLMHLDLELNIAAILKEAGYDVIYKVHPDRIKEVRGVFEDKTRVLTKGHFQNYIGMADIFLFGGIETTAFSIALCTNKPVAAFKMKNELFEPFVEPMKLLEKRCRFIHAEFDERNRIIFDEKELLDVLSKRPEQPNNEFIETYMFPEGVKKR